MSSHLKALVDWFNRDESGFFGCLRIVWLGSGFLLAEEWF
jgi:hypothetical protein